MSWVHVDDELPRNVLPPAALKAVAALLAVVLVLAVVARLTGVGTVTAAERSAEEAVAERLIAFQPEDGAGWVRLTDGASGLVLRELPPGEGGFLRGAVRPLNRERMRAGVDAEAPYLLTLWQDGALTLTDPATGTVVDLNAFGPTNAGAFADLLWTTPAPGHLAGPPGFTRPPASPGTPPHSPEGGTNP
jgi:putative photosynthetic complex assembly protein